MRQTRLCAFLIAPMLLSTLLAIAQVNPVFRVMEQNRRNGTKAILGKKDKKDIKAYTAEMLTDMGYTDSSLAMLKAQGVNLLTLNSQERPWDERTKAALSDCIVIGRVGRIEHPPLEQKGPFQTTAFVDVEKFLRSDYSIPQRRQIQVMIESGPTRIVIPEDTLSLGEHVLLFLSASSLIRYAYHNLPDYYYGQLVNDSTIRFRIIAKHQIASDKVIMQNRERHLPDVLDDIRAVTKCLGRVPNAE
jgi:hypothetical protein